MTREQALAVLQRLQNIAIAKGLFADVAAVDLVSEAITVLKTETEKETLKSVPQ
jgi:hypothetical protein